jgi:hypothetical protein
VQQGVVAGLLPNVALQRKIDAVELSKKAAAEIMADDTYIDNNMVRLEYYGAEQATIFYKDGNKLTIGLVPEWIKPPLEGVDYRTPSTEHIGVTSGPGTYKYIPRGLELQAPRGSQISFGEVVQKHTETVLFKPDAPSGRIVPTVINSRTAPVLCEMLRKCEAEYVATTTAAAEGAIKVLKAVEVVLLVYSLLPATGAATAEGVAARTGRGAAGATGAGMAAAERTLLQEFMALLKSGGSKAITVEGVQFHSVRVVQKGAELVVRRFGIKRLAAEAGQGRIVHAAYERAAVAAAKQAGAKSVRVVMETPVNQAWKTYLESQGYSMQMYEKAGEFGVENLLTKVFNL